MSDVEEDIDPNGSFAYDVAVCYEDDNDDEGKAEIQGVIDKLEQDDWGFLVYDSHRDGEGSVVKRLEKSVDDCRHAIVFLSQKLLEAIKRNVEAPSVTNMETFLCNILQSQDTRLKRKLIVVRLRMECPNVKIPAYLSSYRILNTGEKGFNRQLYKALSKLPGPQTITSMQIRKKVDRIGRSCTEGILAEVAKELEIPEGVLDNIKQEFGGHKRQLMEVLDVWRVHRGPEATLAVADDVIRKATNKPQQVETAGPQSLVGATAAFTGSETPPVITQPNSTLFPDVDETTDCIGNLDLAPKDSMDEKLKEEEKQLSSLPSVPTHAVNGGKKKTSRKDRGQPLSTDV